MYSSLVKLSLVLTSFSVLSIIFFCSAAWFYWKFFEKYKDFPSPLFSIPWLLNIFNIVLRRYPKHFEFESYSFSLLTAICRDFNKEGLVLVWCFQPMLLVFGEEYIKILLNSPSAVNKPFHYGILTDAIGKGVIYHREPLWSKRRKLFNPAFKFNSIKNQIFLFNCTGRLIVDLLLQARNAAAVDAHPIIKRAALKTILATLLEIEVHDKQYEKTVWDAYNFMSRLEAYTEYRFMRPWLYWKPMFNLFFSQKDYEDYDTFVINMLEKMMKLKSSNRSKHDGSEDDSCKSFADILIENHLKDPTFTLREVIEETKTFITEGHDTTAHTILWCLYVLALHPEIQEKAFEEVQSVMEGAHVDISYNDLSKLNYVEAVIKETLRMYPVIPVYGRCTAENIQCGKYRIPKGTALVFNIYMLHRNPDIYPEPEMFDPERFYGKSLKKPWAYVPFAEGLRNCIGKNYALAEMKVFLAHILRSLKVSLAYPDERLAVDWRVVLTPPKPILFKITPR